MLTAAKRTQAKENCHPMQSAVVQVEREFKVSGFAVLLRSKTVNCYVRNDMAGSAPLLRGYKGIMPKAVFKLLVLAVESFIQIKQMHCEAIVRKQLVVVANELCAIVSGNRIKENMLEQMLPTTTVSLDVMVAPAVEERQVLWTTYVNLHGWLSLSLRSPSLISVASQTASTEITTNQGYKDLDTFYLLDIRGLAPSAREKAARVSEWHCHRKPVWAG